MRSQQRATFGTEELAVVLSHYDLGVIESITEFRRGSRRSPKVGIVGQRGKFLVKRRSLKRVELDRIRFAHKVQLFLASKGFPAPRLISTHNHDQQAGFASRELLRIKDYVYEVFEFVRGQPCRLDECGPPEARSAGCVLARFHDTVQGFDLSGDIRRRFHGGYHDAAYVRNGLLSIGSTLSSHDSFSGDEAELATLIQVVILAYDAAADAVDGAGFAGEAEQLVHADWHPGNLVYRNAEVAAVIDFDALKLSRRVTDVANGALQFSLIAPGDPSDWPEQLDEERFAAFLEGYESVSRLSQAERTCIPHLMIEALTAECVPPIAETGSVGRWSGNRVLQMVRRKGEWIANHAERLSAINAP